MVCRRMVATACVIGAVLSLAFSQATDPQRFGGTFETLRVEQQRLVAGWIAEFNQATGNSLVAEHAYNELSPSTRTTFEAVTHALLTTQLTAQDGTALGTGLDLVQLVEAVHGQLPDARGDRQFRLYVLLKPDALNRLYRSREFKRSRDNSVYHIGFPLNFRQQGGIPSMQISVIRTGRRADIDVDYRSSAALVALFNGHLTSANSDVRAGTNFQRHVSRWSGLQDWWQNLFGFFKPLPAETLTMAFGVNIPLRPRVRADRPISEAVYDHFASWFVDASPETALGYISVRAYACLAEFQTGESLESGLAAFRVLRHMRGGLEAYGQVTNLSDVIQGIGLYPKDSRPVAHDHGQLFSLRQVPDSTARSMDCREQLRTTLADPLPYGGAEFHDYFATAMRMVQKQRGPETVLTQLWSKEGGDWKIVSWHIEHPFVAAEPEVPEPAPAAPVVDAPANRYQPGIVRASNAFLRSWLVDRYYTDAAAYFAPRASFCAAIKEASSVQKFLASVGDALPRGPGLSDLITAVPFGHPHLERVSHPEANAFLLTMVSSDLAPSLECEASPPGRASTMGEPRFDGTVYRTDFAVKNAEGEAGEVSLLWRLERKQWRIVAAEVVAQ
jgi:hypothetical protein